MRWKRDGHKYVQSYETERERERERIYKKRKKFGLGAHSGKEGWREVSQGKN